MRNMKWIALATTIGLFAIAGCSSESSTGSGDGNKGGAVAGNAATKPDATDDSSADSSSSGADVATGKSSGGSGDLSIGGVDMPDDLDLDAKPKKGGIGSDAELTIEEPSDSAVDDIFGSVDDDLGIGSPAKTDPAATVTNEPDAAEPATTEPATTEPAAEPDSGASAGSDPFGADPFGAAPAPVKPEMRTWTNAAGTFSTEAVFVDFKDGVVELTKKDGKPAKIPLAGLSKADQDYVKEIVAAREATGSEDSPE